MLNNYRFRKNSTQELLTLHIHIDESTEIDGHCCVAELHRVVTPENKTGCCPPYLHPARSGVVRTPESVNGTGELLWKES